MLKRDRGLSTMGIFNKLFNSSRYKIEQNKESGQPLHTDLQQNISYVKETLGDSSDLIVREIQIGQQSKIQVGIIYIDGLVDAASIQNFIMESLLFDLNESNKHIDRKNVLTQVKDLVLATGDVKEIGDDVTLFKRLLSGYTIILFDQTQKALAISTQGWEGRNVTEPSSAQVIRGPKDAFTESIRVNTTLVRRRIRDKNLRLETKSIGRITQTDVNIMYVKGIADDKVVDEVHERLDRIDIDGILESGNIEELIQDDAYTPFPTMFNSERPDQIAAGLLEGRIAIFIDGTPFVLLVPALFAQFFQSPEDYYQRADIGSLLRLLRYKVENL